MELLINLSINGLATGVLLFLLASGLSLIFGLMDVLNFAHGALFAWGAYAGVWAYNQTGSFVAGVAAALITGVAFGFLLERFIIQTVYGNHIRQILITLGMMLILNELLKVVWGPDQKSASTPSYLSGSWMLGDVTLIKYRLFIIVVGLSVFFLLYYLLNHTRMGLIVRAGVMNKEMVQALGINIHRVFLYVFILGSALAALAGALFAPYSGVIYAELGMEFAILAFIVVVIGGMGNIVGSLMAALLVGLTGAYLAYFVPELSLAANMLLMAVILLWKPSGLFGVKR